MIVGVGVLVEGTGVITDAGGVGTGLGVEIRAFAEGAVGLFTEEEEDEVVVVDPLLLADLMTVVVEDAVIDPFTHYPFSRMSPSLLEQVLQPTPPSLKVNA